MITTIRLWVADVLRATATAIEPRSRFMSTPHPITVRLDGRQVAEAVTREALRRSARN